MNISGTLNVIPDTTKKTFNKTQKTTRKLVKARTAVLFNEVCLKENILPKYSNVRLHDQRAKKQPFTESFRRNLVEHQLKVKETEVSELEQKLSTLHQTLNESELESDTKQKLFAYLDEKRENFEHSEKAKVIRKLSKLYGASIKIAENGKKNGYINLSTVELTEAQHQLLNLGLNCHYQSKRNIIDKQTELELLYNNILKLEEQDKVSVHPDLKGQLAGEGSKLRGSDYSKLLTKELREAGKQLKEDSRIIVRRADKSSSFVILNREDYNSKLNQILADKTKFQRLKEDPTKKLKAKVNRIIKGANALVGGVHFEPIVGEYTPGYAYGTIKTHKTNNPLRPIISQVCTPTYKLAKKLNQLLKPYVPSGFSINSTDEFLDILRIKKPQGELASIDVESLFTNVPVDATIEIIIDEVYHRRSNGLDKLPLSPDILRNLLVACTKDSPFKGPDGKLYSQKDGVAMGSPLGPLFANFYMAKVEHATLNDPDLRPSTYCRYVDDIFVEVRDSDHLSAIIQGLEKNSVLTFTSERQHHNCLTFLDVTVESTPDRYITSVYVKPTNNGKTLHASSECPSKYKNSVLRAFATRAVKTSSTYELMHAEFNRSKQLLVNNGYTNTEVDHEIRRQLDKKCTQQPTENQQPTEQQQQATTTTTSNTQQPTEQSTQKVHNIYYRNYMNTQYQTDEKILKDIIKKNVKCNRDNERLQINIYYQNHKTRELVMKNSPTTVKQSNRTNVVYRYTCPHEDCRPRHICYVGATTTTLARRLTMHIQEHTGPAEHWLEHHKQKPTHKHLKENTEIIASTDDHRRLFIHEAIHIVRHKPTLNIQQNTNISLALWGV